MNMHVPLQPYMHLYYLPHVGRDLHNAIGESVLGVANALCRYFPTFHRRQNQYREEFFRVRSLEFDLKNEPHTI
jgi:hypothetical protein